MKMRSTYQQLALSKSSETACRIPTGEILAVGEDIDERLVQKCSYRLLLDMGIALNITFDSIDLQDSPLTEKC